MDYLVHDLKADRPNISGGLPPLFRLVPIAFYIGAAVSILLNLYYYASIRNHQQAEKAWDKQVTQAQMEQTNIVQQQTALGAQAIAAGEIADWLDGARPIQPISTMVVRSMEANATIAELDLSRNPQMPAQLMMTLKVNHAGSEQIEATLDSLASIDYQTYSAQQVKIENAVDFKATLVWNELK